MINSAIKVTHASIETFANSHTAEVLLPFASESTVENVLDGFGLAVYFQTGQSYRDGIVRTYC